MHETLECTCAAQRPTSGTHNTLTLLALLWNCCLVGLRPMGTPPLAQNTAICMQFCNNQSLTPSAARRPTGGTHNTLTLSALLWNCRFDQWMCPRLHAKHCMLPATLLEHCACIACGTASEKWHSQHPHAFGASLELSLGRPPTGGPTTACTKHCNLHALLQ